MCRRAVFATAGVANAPNARPEACARARDGGERRKRIGLYDARRARAMKRETDAKRDEQTTVTTMTTTMTDEGIDDGSDEAQRLRSGTSSRFRNSAAPR